jgi:hypothetical protein
MEETSLTVAAYRGVARRLLVIGNAALRDAHPWDPK